MKLKTTSIINLFICFLLGLTLISCGKEELIVPEPIDPRDMFLGTFSSTTNRYCNDVDAFNTIISKGTSANTVIWSNVLGIEGNEDDVVASIVNNTIVVAKQNIGKLELEATGNLMPNGNIEFSSVATQGVATIWCDYEFSSK